jgi:para-aminobenzoate synthetase component 1
MRDVPFETLAYPLPLADPLQALGAIADLPQPFLLASTLPGPRARWSFFGADPFESFRGGRWDEAAAAWRAARRGARSRRAPFTGGAVGYWAYDFGRRLERWRNDPGDGTPAADDLGLPDFVLGLYDVVGAIDAARGQAWLFSSGRPETGPARARRARERLATFARRLEAAISSTPPAAAIAASIAPPHSTFERAAYLDAVARVRGHIARGDIFQANLSQRWSAAVAPTTRPGALGRALFEALARCSPAPHAAFLDLGDHAVVSASPERFLELRGDRVETRPIKGTRRRGVDTADDAARAVALAHSPKDRAENVMIVDVLRNDLGRVCETGSVEVPALCELERFPQVFHLTSTVTGTLRPGLDALDLLTACFPGGSITGAPKLRAIEIIDALEPVRRHIYTGAIGYLDWSGDADWNVAIRTATVTPRALHFAAGGGVTADSEPAAEYDETLDKAAGLMSALGALSGVRAGVTEVAR